MAVYKIFPEKDTFIFTEDITGNAGKDEVLEIGSYPVSNIGQTSRILLKFSTTEIREVIDSYIGSKDFKSYLGLYLCNAYQIPTDCSILCYPVSGSWDCGVGKFDDDPVNVSGVSWLYRNSNSLNEWTVLTGSYASGVTGSYKGSYPGGGDWYYEYSGSSMLSSYTFPFNSNHDILLDITNPIKLQYSGSLNNEGYILKFEDNLEFNSGSSNLLKYYGVDTNTIYPPHLDFKWDDSFYSSSLSVLDTSISTLKIKNNKQSYINEGKQRFRLSVRPKFPQRTFTTSSIYLVNYILPQNSYWGVKDENTNEMVIDFDTSYTKISADNSGSYFDVYMSGLEPERYYRILVKTILDGSTTLLTDPNIIKVIRDGE